MCLGAAPSNIENQTRRRFLMGSFFVLHFS